LQCVNLFCNLSKSILLFFSYISSLLLLFSPLIVEELICTTGKMGKQEFSEKITFHCHCFKNFSHVA
jgi:hypothetical protein